MKEIIGKTKANENSFPKRLIINDKVITEKSSIAKSLNDFFVNIGPKLASVIPSSSKTFESFLPEINTFLNDSELTEKELLNTFQSLKNNKSPGFDELHVNVINSVFNEIKISLLHILGTL